MEGGCEGDVSSHAGENTGLPLHHPHLLAVPLKHGQEPQNSTVGEKDGYSSPDLSAHPRKHWVVSETTDKTFALI